MIIEDPYLTLYLRVALERINSWLDVIGLFNYPNSLVLYYIDTTKYNSHLYAHTRILDPQDCLL